ncbi:uncharacterized protein IWZ02DRAFT_502594 [Phyllosticta citriasiana]|uniref:uncharacterized protein n=1 Tax=Phyllosticta citriasiana TaxID=595635 RepID=UPI0030FDE72E
MSSSDIFSDASSQELQSIIYRLLQQHRRNGDRLRSIAIRYHNTHPDARLDQSIPKDLRAESFAKFCPSRGTSQAAPSSPGVEDGQAVLEKARGMLRADPHSISNLRRARQLLRQGAVPLVNAFYLLPPEPMARRNRNDPEHTSELDSSQLSVDPLFADDTVFQAAMTSHRDDSRNLERDWVHDRFEDDDSRHPSRSRGHPLRTTFPPESGYKIRVENLHYELTEDDIYELFERIGPVENARLMYDRHDRSEGVAFVTYRSLADARVACREYDGANAHGQPIRSLLSHLALRHAATLWTLLNVRAAASLNASNLAIEASVLTRPVVQGRPRKTQDELDAEMEDYWGVGHDGAADAPVNGSGDVQSGPANPGAAANNAINDDMEMEVE